MNKIYMSFDNYRFKLIIINTDSKLMSIEDNVFHIDENETKRILEIIDSLSDSGGRIIFDPVRFSITSDKNGKITTYEGNSNTCSNFSMLDDWIGEMYDKYI